MFYLVIKYFYSLIIKDRIIYLIAPTYNYLIPGQMHWIGMHIPRIVHTILAQAYNTGNKLYWSGSNGSKFTATNIFRSIPSYIFYPKTWCICTMRSCKTYHVTNIYYRIWTSSLIWGQKMHIDQLCYEILQPMPLRRLHEQHTEPYFPLLLPIWNIQRSFDNSWFHTTS